MKKFFKVAALTLSLSAAAFALSDTKSAEVSAQKQTIDPPAKCYWNTTACCNGTAGTAYCPTCSGC